MQASVWSADKGRGARGAVPAVFPRGARAAPRRLSERRTAGSRGLRPAVVERVDLLFDFGREADAVEAVAAQALHGVADLADLAHARVGVAVFDVDERLRLDALDRVIRVVGHVALTSTLPVFE